LVCCFAYAGGCGFFPIFLPVPPFAPVARLLASARAMRPGAWSPGFSPPAHCCGSSAQGFSLLRVHLTPCIERMGRYSRYSRLARPCPGALQGLPRSPWRTSPLSRPSKPCPALHWLLGWHSYAGAPTGHGHPGCSTFRSEVWLQALRTPPRGGALPVAYCFPPTGAVWTLTMQPSRLRGVRRAPHNAEADRQRVTSTAGLEFVGLPGGLCFGSYNVYYVNPPPAPAAPCTPRRSRPPPAGHPDEPPGATALARP
jgi:hypothetical protein